MVWKTEGRDTIAFLNKLSSFGICVVDSYLKLQYSGWTFQKTKSRYDFTE